MSRTLNHEVWLLIQFNAVTCLIIFRRMVLEFTEEISQLFVVDAHIVWDQIFTLILHSEKKLRLVCKITCTV